MWLALGRRGGEDKADGGSIGFFFAGGARVVDLKGQLGAFADQLGGAGRIGVRAFAEQIGTEDAGLTFLTAPVLVGILGYAAVSLDRRIHTHVGELAFVEHELLREVRVFLRLGLVVSEPDVGVMHHFAIAGAQFHGGHPLVFCEVCRDGEVGVLVRPFGHDAVVLPDVDD